jgi:hypothetical protein
MKRFFLLFLSLFAFSPFLSIASPILDQTAEQKSKIADQTLERFDQKLSFRERKELREETKQSLDDPTLRRLYDEREGLKKEALYWDRVAALKKDLLALPGGSSFLLSEKTIEAEKIAETAITGFDELKKQYSMMRPGVLHNFFVNAHIKDQGLCWHWARDFSRKFLKLHLKDYAIHWATAYEGKLREHNTVIITFKGREIQDGLLIDGWRHSGKPFWILVLQDHYPWKPGTYTGPGSLE